eukprot:m.8606 g.8606  ORF g.8606 m.8606 type:complete len:802 (-) comp7022_c0_seq1:33-2438(-)
MPAKAMSSLRWSSSRDSLGHQSNTKHNDSMKAVTSRLSHYDDTDDNTGIVIDDDYIGIDGVENDDNVIDTGKIPHSSSSPKTQNKRHSAPIKVTITPTKPKESNWGRSKSTSVKVQVNDTSIPPQQQRSASVSLPNQSSNRSRSPKKPGMVQLAVGIRMDSETLDQALHVAEVAARAGGSVLKQFSTATEATSASIIAIKVENAINDVLDQSDLGFDVHLRCQNEGSVWSEGNNQRTNHTEEELSRAPTWLVKGLCGESDAHGAVTRDTVVSVGLAVGLVPAVGVVYDPFQEHVYTARIGEEAKINGKVITNLAKPLNIDDMVICTNISAPDEHEANDFREHCSGTLQNLMKAGIYKIKMLGSPARCIVDVAIGRACGYFECGPKASDVCAALVIAQCAQQVVTNIGENIQPPTITGASLNNEHTCDVNARRFLCASSKEVKDKLMSCIAWPIPYMVRDDDHPFVEDTTDEFESLQVCENVLSGVKNTNGSVSSNGVGIPSKQRWSDRPVSKANEVAAPELNPILVPKSHFHMFEALKRQNNTPIIEVEESIPALKPPKSRRDREIELYCAKEVNAGGTTSSYAEDLDNEALSWNSVAFTGSSKTQLAKTGWSNDRASTTDARRRRDMEIKLADDRASLILDRALGLDTDTDHIDVSVPINLTAGGDEAHNDEFDSAAKQVEEVYQLQQSVHADQIKSIVAKSLSLSNSDKWAASTTTQTRGYDNDVDDDDNDFIFSGGDESSSLNMFQPHADSVINDEDLKMTIDEWNEPPQREIDHTPDLHVPGHLDDYLNIQGQDDDE